MRKSFFPMIVFTAVIIACLSFSACGGKNDNAGNNGGPTVVRIAHNYPQDMDPAWRDPVTGEPFIGQEDLSARVYAEQQVLEKLNVKIEWVDYMQGDLSEILLRTVLAGDPLGELVRCIYAVEGTLLGQNVLQPLDDFADIFDDEDSSWMFLGKVYGHNYFLNDRLRPGNDAPLLYNIGMLNRVPALKENGKTVLPVDLWLEGKWTWSVFEDYLQKIHNYYAQLEGDVIAYGANYSHAAQMAIHSNGVSVYGDKGLEFDSPAAKEAVAYIERLMSRNLIRARDIVPGTSTIPLDADQWWFRDGTSVFANILQHHGMYIINSFNERGDTIGIVPFPRPDRMEPDDPDYGQLVDAKDSYIVPRGISKEMAELALRAFREYIVSYHKKMAGSDRALDYLQSDAVARSSALLRSVLDVTNEDYGDKLIAAWNFLGLDPHVNEHVKNTGLWQVWNNDILGDSLYRVNGASSYAVQVEAKMPVINEIMNNMQKAIGSTEFIDNIPPRFIDVGGAGMVFPVGTNPAAINWNLFFTISDNVDNTFDFADIVADLSRVNFDKPGRYENAATFSIRDSSGNEGKTERAVVVFDAANTTAPSLVIKGGFRNIAVNENTDNINWRGDFVESATDKDGLDIRDSVFADLSQLNTTLAGSYTVTLFVRDYAGNEVSAEITVDVR